MGKERLQAAENATGYQTDWQRFARWHLDPAADPEYEAWVQSLAYPGSAPAPPSYKKPVALKKES